MVTRYLTDLLPATSRQRSGLSLGSAVNLTLFPCKSDRFKISFFPDSTGLWNALDNVIRDSDSLNTFKNRLKNFFDISNYKKRFSFALDRYSSILHTRLRLNCCALNYYLFKISCIPSPVCKCGFHCKSVIHYNVLPKESLIFIICY